MQTIKLQLEDNLYKNVLNSGIDVQAKFKEFLFDLVDDEDIRDYIFKGYTISYLIDNEKNQIALLDIFKWVNK